MKAKVQKKILNYTLLTFINFYACSTAFISHLFNIITYFKLYIFCC